jgi:hypothetical protein
MRTLGVSSRLGEISTHVYKENQAGKRSTTDGTVHLQCPL